MNNNLIDKINNSDNWPNFIRGDFLNELDEIAENTFSKETLEGYLASLLIYHQLCEEMIRLLIKNSEFFVELSIYPNSIKFKKKDKMMVGQLINELESTINFEKKMDFLNKCRKFNEVRNGIVHRLTKSTSLKSIYIKSKKSKELYHEIFQLFEEIHEWFQLSFKDFKKDVFVDYVD